MSNLFKKLKWVYQRARYGYDETIKWEFDSYFSQFIKPLKEFCEEELKNLTKKEFNYNKKRNTIFQNTLRLIKDYEEMPYEDGYKSKNAETKLWKYFGKHIGYYWN